MRSAAAVPLSAIERPHVPMAVQVSEPAALPLLIAAA